MALLGFPPVEYLSLSETSPNRKVEDNTIESSIRRVSLSSPRGNGRNNDGLILGIGQEAEVGQSRTPSSSSSSIVVHHRILLQRKLRHTGTGGDIYVGFVLQDDDDHVTTPDNEVQVVHVRMERVVRENDDGGAIATSENDHHSDDDGVNVILSPSSSSSSLWETSIDPGFRVLQWLHDQLLQRLDETPGHGKIRSSSEKDHLICSNYKLDLSPHLLLAKNECHAVCVSPRRSNAQSLTDVIADHIDNESSNQRLTEISVKNLFRDIITGLKTLHGMGVCHRNINADTIVVLCKHNNNNANHRDDDNNDPHGMCALVSGLESCRTIQEASTRPPVNQTPQCVPPEVWKGTMTTMKKETPNGAATPEQHQKPQQQQQQQDQNDVGQREDLWAAGVILSMLLIKAPLFGAPLSTDTAFQNVLRTSLGTNATDGSDINTLRFPLSNHMALELLHSMLAEDPKDRLTLEQICHHEWLSSSSTGTIQSRGIEENV